MLLAHILSLSLSSGFTLFSSVLKYLLSGQGRKRTRKTHKKREMIIPIIILIFSILFLAKFLNLNFSNSCKRLFSVLKKPFHPSPASPLPASVSSTSSPTSKEDDDLKRVFNTFDNNGDRCISREELEGLLGKIGLSVPMKEVDKMVGNLDSNKDGLIDFEEFQEFMIGKEREEEDLKEAFDVFDGDRDGLITVEELRLVLTSLGMKEGRREEDCKEMITKVDVDGDGMVNFEEFKRMMMMMRGLKP